MTDLVAPGDSLVGSCRSREREPEPNTFSIPLDRDEVNKFAQSELTEMYFLSYDDHQEPPVHHYFAVYRRPGLACRDRR